MSTEAREGAYQDYCNGMKYKQIAEKYGVSLSAVKSWAARYWKVATAETKGRDQEKLQPRKKRRNNSAPKGNKYAVGNRGGAAPKGNHNAMTHGLYAKYLPDETREIAKGFGGASPIDLLWDAICLKYAAIVRAQQIMHVEDKHEIIEHVKTESDKSTTYEFQFAWDRQASFLVAQSKAMSALTTMIKQYEEICRSDLATEEQRLRIAKLKAEIAGEDTADDVTIVDDIVKEDAHNEDNTAQ